MRSFLLVLSAASLVACGGSGGGSTSAGVFTSLELTTDSPNAYQYGPATALTLTPMDQNGHTMSLGGAVPTWTISDTSKVAISGTTVVVKPGAVGDVMIGATLTLGGITKTSPQVSETVDIAPSSGSFVAMSTGGAYGTNTFSPSSIDLKSGGRVAWSGLTSGSGHNVHFVAITPFASGTSATNGLVGSSDTASVTITAAPGSYAFHCDHHPSTMTGTVTVH